MKNVVIRVSGVGNRIYAGTLNKKNPYIMNDSKKDVTDQAINAVFQHLQEEHRRNDRGSKSYGYEFEGLGEIHFHPPKDSSGGAFYEDLNGNYSTISEAHKLGVDLIMETGTPIHSQGLNGEVVKSAFSETKGNWIIIKQQIKGTEYHFVYMHLSERKVEVGDKVSSGQIIGLSGNTGNSTGPHLRFEVWEDGPRKAGSKDINPLEFIRKMAKDSFTEVVDGVLSDYDEALKNLAKYKHEEDEDSMERMRDELISFFIKQGYTMEQLRTVFNKHPDDIEKIVKANGGL